MRRVGEARLRRPWREPGWGMVSGLEGGFEGDDLFRIYDSCIDALPPAEGFTLSGQFSPTTRYRDYAVSPTLVHWERQSVTREDSPTGLRYREHAKRGTAVMLFARMRADERAFMFLGPATYVGHQGELPMAVTWRLHHPLPGDVFARFAAAVA